MEISTLSSQWTLMSSELIHDVIPKGKEHYAGDECWCIPFRTSMKHYKYKSKEIVIWVHRPNNNSGQKELRDALSQLVRHWDGIYHF